MASDRKKRIKKIFICLLVAFISLIGIVGLRLILWYRENFNETLTVLMFTIISPIKGANTDIIKTAFWACEKSIFVWLVAVAAFVLLYGVSDAVNCYMGVKLGKKEKRLNLTKILTRIIPVISCIGFAVTMIIAFVILKVPDYFRSRYVESDFVETHYVAPDVSAIKAKHPRNLIHIYMESMEPTFASMEAGGKQPVNNYIPNLTKIASDNISFSNSDKLGGFHNVTGTGWTAAATFASQSGLPYLSPTRDLSNDYSSMITIGDILKGDGYFLEYICGSDASFANRRNFLKKHGDFKIMDYYAALEEEYIDPEHFVWWGYEDKYLYEIAKSEITKAAEDKSRPFDITILTVDTHYYEGYVCDLCGNEYADQYSNVVKCADNQIKDFIDWCMQQDWYEDTVIFIQGDHPYMQKTYLVAEVPDEQRTTYNCFINTDYDPAAVNKINRTFLCMDLMPTILSSIGYEIPGERIGLGTNLFSDVPTLAEQLGVEYIDAELNKHSEWYQQNIVWGEK